MARVVIPGVPHHVTQRGNRRFPTFFQDGDYEKYLRILGETCSKYGVDIWAYCLMTNHVHFVAVPAKESSLRWAFGETHQEYSRYVNVREGWRGYLWQGRFSSFPMDERHLVLAAKYIELNPCRANMVRTPEEYTWSSARAHIQGRNDRLVKVQPLLTLVPDWRNFLLDAFPDESLDSIRLHQRTGRPLGSEEFIRRLEIQTARSLTPGKAGRKPAEMSSVSPD